MNHFILTFLNKFISAGRDKCISETESKYDFVLPDGCCDVWRDLLCAEL